MFVGSEFRQLVESLMESLGDTVEGLQTPRLVLLEAESGAGKSRVIREFYNSIRIDTRFQKLNPDGCSYWPPLEEDSWLEDGMNSGFNLRKVLGPPVTEHQRPPGTFPGFMWQAIRCDLSSDESAISLLESLSPSLTSHLGYLAFAWGKVSNAPEQFQRWFKEHLDKAFFAGATHASALDALIVLLDKLEILKAFPGLGFAVDLGLSGLRAARDSKRTHNDIRIGGGLPQTGVTSEQIANLLLRFTHRKLPLILVLEDMHLISQQLADVVKALLLAPDEKSILVIGTVWPESANREEFSQLIDEIGATPRHNVIRHVGSKKDPFPEMQSPDIYELVRGIAPKTSESILAEFGKKWRNPLALRLVLQSKQVQSFILDGALVLTNGQIAKLPQTVFEVYRLRWRELKPEYRDILALLAGLLPQEKKMEGLARFPLPQILEFFPDFVSESKGVDDVREAIMYCVAPLHWLAQSESTENVFMFRERAAQQIALEFFQEEYAHDALLVQRLNERSESSIRFAVDGWLDELNMDSVPWHIIHGAKLLSRRGGIIRPSVLAIATLSDAQFKFDAGRFSDFIRMAKFEIIEALPESHRLRVEMAAQVMNAAWQSRQYELVTEWFQKVEVEKFFIENPGYSSCLRARNLYADALSLLGRSDEALHQIACLYSIDSTMENPHTRLIKASQASVLHGLRRHREALVIYDELLATETPETGDYLSLLLNRAGTLNQLGYKQRALEDYQDCVRLSTKVHGPEDHETYKAECNRIQTVLEMGHSLVTLISEIEELKAKSIINFGKTHLTTIHLVIFLAEATYKVSGLKAAIAVIDEFGTDAQVAADPDQVIALELLEAKCDLYLETTPFLEVFLTEIESAYLRTRDNRLGQHSRDRFKSFYANALFHAGKYLDAKALNDELCANTGGFNDVAHYLRFKRNSVLCEELMFPDQSFSNVWLEMVNSQVFADGWSSQDGQNIASGLIRAYVKEKNYIAATESYIEHLRRFDSYDKSFDGLELDFRLTWLETITEIWVSNTHERPSFEELIEWSKVHFGPTSREYLKAIFYYVESMSASSSYVSQLVIQIEAVFGVGHHASLSATCSLASVHEREGNLDIAIELLEAVCQKAGSVPFLIHDVGGNHHLAQLLALYVSAGRNLDCVKLAKKMFPTDEAVVKARNYLDLVNYSTALERLGWWGELAILLENRRTYLDKMLDATPGDYLLIREVEGRLGVNSESLEKMRDLFYDIEFDEQVADWFKVKVAASLSEELALLGFVGQAREILESTEKKFSGIDDYFDVLVQVAKTSLAIASSDVSAMRTQLNVLGEILASSTEEASKAELHALIGEVHIVLEEYSSANFHLEKALADLQAKRGSEEWYFIQVEFDYLFALIMSNSDLRFATESFGFRALERVEVLVANGNLALANEALTIYTHLSSENKLDKLRFLLVGLEHEPADPNPQRDFRNPRNLVTSLINKLQD